MTERMTEQVFLDDRMKGPVAVYLITGICLRGKLESHDAEAVFLRPYSGRASEVQMIYKIAISTIASAPPIDDRNSAEDLESTLLKRARRGCV